MKFLSSPAVLLSLCGLLLPITVANPLDLAERAAAAGCTCAMQKAAVAAEIKTISSHSAADAAAIPLDPLASRTFFITPAEFGGAVTIGPVNVGVTADTVRAELVVLATLLNANVPTNPAVNYTCNANGTTTVDFIQTDSNVLPYSHVREIHSFDAVCNITTILGYVNGNLLP